MDRKETDLYFTDQEVDTLINERKLVSENENISNLKSLYGVLKGSIVTLIGESHKFELRSRVISKYRDDFSVILSVIMEDLNDTFRLLRYNGFHQHKNKYEGIQLKPGFHIHKATEHYQQAKYRKHDGYAELTDRYDNMHSALRCMVKDCNIIIEEEVKNQADLL